MAALLAGFLGIEAVLALLFVPIVARTGNGPVALRVAIAAALAVAFIVGAAIAPRRRRTALIFGTLLQVALIACGAIAWPMYVLGVIFLALWYAAVRLIQRGRVAPHART
jgi:hypothetical protein